MPMPTAPPGPEDRLDSWKEIAGYLKRGVRTVQRWEQASGLPVHRLDLDRRGSVYAYKQELDAWWDRRRRPGSEETTELSASETATDQPLYAVLAAPRPRNRLWLIIAIAAGLLALASRAG
jgi:hypothetical protein